MPIRMHMSTSNSKHGSFLSTNNEITCPKGSALMQMYIVVPQTKRGNSLSKFIRLLTIENTFYRKHKTRAEAINAIIARSQSQAQALLTAGGYYDNTMMSPRGQRSGANASPRPHMESLDNSFSEDLSIASLPAMHYGHKTS